MASVAERQTTPAHEAQKLFFEIGMDQRARVGSALSVLGLTFAQAHALRLLDPELPLPMSALAERLFCDASNVTGIADRLESRGLAVRESDPADRRVKLLTITDAGRALADSLHGGCADEFPGIAGLSGADRTELVRLLRLAFE